MCNVYVNNMPDYANQFVVCRLVNGELWFYGSWSEKKKAEKIASEFENGIVVENID